MSQTMQHEMMQTTHTPGSYNPPLNCHYVQLPTQGVSDDIMKISIGGNGKVFKAITNRAGVNYIWYNKEHHYVEIWGPEQKLQDAYNRVVERIQTIMTKVASGEIKLKENREENVNRKKQKKEEQRKQSQQNMAQTSMDMSE